MKPNRLLAIRAFTLPASENRTFRAHSLSSDSAAPDVLFQHLVVPLVMWLAHRIVASPHNLSNVHLRQHSCLRCSRSCICLLLVLSA